MSTIPPGADPNDPTGQLRRRLLPGVPSGGPVPLAGVIDRNPAQGGGGATIGPPGVMAGASPFAQSPGMPPRPMIPPPMPPSPGGPPLPPTLPPAPPMMQTPYGGMGGPTQIPQGFSQMPVTPGASAPPQLPPGVDPRELARRRGQLAGLGQLQ
jgi:hypothetical protein